MVRIDAPGPNTTPESYTDMDFIDPQHGWIARGGDSRHKTVLHTGDGGRTWKEQPTSAVHLDFASDQVGWLIHNRTRRTVNGGLSWADTTAPGGRQIAAISAEEAWTIEGRSLRHITDNGRRWRAVPHPLNGNKDFSFEALFFLDQQHGWALGWARGNPAQMTIDILRTVDGGKTFQTARLPEVGIGNATQGHLFFLNSQEGWAAMGGPLLLHTQDGGQTWVAITPSVDGRILPASYNDCCFTSPTEGWAVGCVRGEALAITTNDGGRTWRRSLTGAESINDSELTRVAFPDATHGWVLGEGGISPSDFPVARHMDMVSFVLGFNASGNAPASTVVR